MKQLRAGKLSDAGATTIAKTMPEGRFRTIGELGAGQNQVADHVVGNVAGHQGQMVRKLPLGLTRDLPEFYGGLPGATRHMNQLVPGSTAEYIAATPRGAFQQLGSKTFKPTAEEQAVAARMKVQPLDVRHRNVTQALEGHGYQDIRPGNFSPGGQVIDFYREGAEGALGNEPLRRLSLMHGQLAPGHVDRLRAFEATGKQLMAPNAAVSAEQRRKSLEAYYARLQGMNKDLNRVTMRRFYDAPMQGQPAMQKLSFLQELGNQWNSLDTQGKVMTGLGGTLALGSLVNGLTNQNAGAGNTLAGLGGLALAGYGLSGGQLPSFLRGQSPVRELQSPFAAAATKSVLAPPAAGATPTPAVKTPWFARYMRDDGSVDYRGLMNTPDDELRQNFAKLSPGVRAQLQKQLATYKPGLLQSLGARLVGVNIEGQKDRFGRLLEGK